MRNFAQFFERGGEFVKLCDLLLDDVHETLQSRMADSV